jgi:hypothetical protein
MKEDCATQSLRAMTNSSVGRKPTVAFGKIYEGRQAVEGETIIAFISKRPLVPPTFSEDF